MALQNAAKIVLVQRCLLAKNPHSLSVFVSASLQADSD
jgi:hypothetical protein